MLRYLDYLMEKDNGANIIDEYSITFSELFNINDNLIDIQSHESSCVPALGYYRANRKCYKCNNCSREITIALMVKPHKEVNGEEYLVCPNCHSENVKRVF
jgi:DNA-directed RNA polymerase subunit RPC12/RpoP